MSGICGLVNSVVIWKTMRLLNSNFMKSKLIYTLSNWQTYSLIFPGHLMDVDCQGAPGSITDLPASKVTVLHGHQSEVFTCAWSPQSDIIVSGLDKHCSPSPLFFLKSEILHASFTSYMKP